MKLPGMRLSAPNASGHRWGRAAPTPAPSVVPQLDPECVARCLENFSVCGYLAWETEEYCAQEFAHCLAGC